MRIYTIDAPNGRTYEIEGPDGATDAQLVAALLAQEPSAGQSAPSRAPAPPSAPVRQSTFVGELIRGVKQPVSSALTGIASLVRPPEEAALSGLQRGEAISEEAGEGPSLARIGRVFSERGALPAAGQVISDIPKAIAGQAGTIGTALAGGKLGAMAGAPLGPVGALVGGALGGTAALVPSMFGSNIERQAAERLESGQPVEINRGVAGAAAAGQAALEAGGLAVTLGRRAISGLLGIKPQALATDAAKQKLVAEAARTIRGGVVRGAAVEMPVEVAQSVIERAQAGLDVTSTEAFKEYGEAAYLAGLVGGPLGGVGTAVSRRGAARELAALEPPPAPPTPPTAEPSATPEPSAALPALDTLSDTDRLLEAIRLREIPEKQRTAEEVARLKEIDAFTARRIQEQRDITAYDTERAAQSAFAQPTPTQVEQRATMLMPYEERALQRQAEAAAPEETEATPTSTQLELPGIVPRENIVTREMLAELGLPLQPKTLKQKGVASWMDKNAVGRSLEEIQELIKQRPELAKGQSLQAKLLRELVAPTPTPFVEPTVTTPVEEAERGPTVRADVSESGEPELGGRLPSVDVSEGMRGKRKGAIATSQPEAPVVRGVERVEPATAAGNVPEGAQPTAVTPTEPVRRGVEPPLKENLSPEKENQLRTKLKTQLPQLRTLEAQRDQVAREYDVAELAGNEATKAALAPALENARRALKKATSDATRTYWQLYDIDKSDAQAAVRQQLFEADEAAREARRTEDMSVPLRKRRGEYPYNLKTLQAVHDELRDQLSHTPEYKKFIEKNFTLDRSRVKNNVNETKVIEEGQQLLDRMVFQKEITSAETPLSPSSIEELEANNVTAALYQLAQTTQNPQYKQLALRLVRLLGKTQVTLSDDLRNDKNQTAAGAATRDGLRIWLDRTRGLNEETLLHEAVHAASEQIIDTTPDQRSLQQNAAVKELNELWNAAKADPDITLGPDARAKLSEFVTEALTNPALVEQLQAKPWTLRNAWESFKKTILKMLGVTYPTNMQEAAIAAMDTVFIAPEVRGGTTTSAQKKVPDQPALFQLAPQQPMTAAQMLESMRTEPEKRSLRAMINGAFGGAGKGAPGAYNDDVVSLESRIRTRVSDRAATIFDKLMEAVNKGMISETQSRATQNIFKQAEAVNQMVPSFYRLGAIERDPIGGWKATTLLDAEGNRVLAPADVLPLVEAWGKKRGLPMDKAMADVGRLMESARQYVFREHNRNAAPGDPYLPQSMTDTQIDTLYPEYKADKDLAKIKEALDKARFKLIDQMVEVGRLDNKTAQEWKEASEYIPFDRLSNEELGRYENARFRPQKRVGKGLSALGGLPELANAKWVTRPVGNALENYFGTLGWMMQQVVRTDAVNTTLAQLEKINQAKPSGRVRPPGESFVKTYQDGYEYFYKVPTIYHAVAFNAQVAPLPKIFEFFGTISRVLRTTITALPTFTATQLPQDIQRAIVYSGVQNPAALTQKVLSNFKQLSQHALKGTLVTATPDLSISGVVGDVDFRANDPAKSLLEELGYESPTLLRSKAAGKLLHRMNELSRAGDIAVRKGIYEQTLEETNDRLLALRRAREVINFRTTGAGDPLGVLPVMLQTIPFFNAYVQGMDVLYRALTGKGAVSGLARKQALRKFYSMAGSLAAFSALYALAMSGDEEYENIPLDERDKTWVLGGGIGVPVPSEIGMIFKAIPERIVEAAVKYGSSQEAAGMLALSSWFKTALKEYGGRLMPVPAAVKPLLEAWVNHSFFTGRELEGTYLKDLEPAERATSATSEFAKEVARFAHNTGIAATLKGTLNVDLSPIIVDNTLRGYFGTAAALSLATMDAMFSDRADRPLHHYVGLGGFTYDPVGTRQSDEFYDTREKVVRAHQTLNRLMKLDPAQAAEYAEANKEKLMMYRAVNGTLRQLEKTRVYKNWLDTSAAAQELSSSERLRQKQEVQKYEQSLMSWIREARTELNL